MDKMESNRNRLIEMLATNKDQYVSGQMLSDRLNISRSAIWKHMHELKKDGYEIEGISRKGYRIVGFPDKVSENTLQWGLKTAWLGKTIIHKETTTTTQQIAHQAAQDGAKHGTVVIADEQTKGKGRMSRHWHSSKNKGVWMSIILRPDIPPNLAPQLTLVSATALADTVSKLSLQPKIKWPNDILLNNKKTAGILTEMQAEQDQIQYVVMGMGINVNQANEDLPEDIKDRATSLSIESGKTWNLKNLIQQILLDGELAYDAYIKNGFPHVKKKWESYGYRIGEQIMIKTLRKEWQATLVGIDDDGALLTQMNDGETKKVYSGEIDWFRKGEHL